MTEQTHLASRGRGSRRGFLIKASALAAVSAGSIGRTSEAAAVPHVGGSDLLRVGLIGCGGRGTGAAAQALNADKNVRLVAMADMFDDRLQGSLATLKTKKDVSEKIDVPADRQFVGFDAYKELIACGVDVVLLATPPHFRPAHLKAAVDAGLHIFSEKPVAVDAPGVRSVLASCELARQKDLSIVSGLCLRYSYGFQEVVKRIGDGAIGQITMLQANDYRGTIWLRNRQPEWTDMHNQMRNWYYYTWVSGDFNVEQHVHFLDVCAWAAGNRYPARAIGMGGRQVRTGPEYGNIFDHHSVIYEYEDGAKLISNTRQMRGCKNNMSALVVGTKGHARFSERRGGLTITSGDDTWVYEGEENQFYQTEHDMLFASIRSGKPMNNGQYMAQSTMLAIMGRMATYTGQEIEWDKAMNSQEDLTPEKYQWGPAPKVEIAVPGETKFF